MFFSFLVFSVEFSLFKLLQYTTDYLNALTVISYALVGLGLGSWLANWVAVKGARLTLAILSASWLSLAFAVWKILRFPSSGPDALLISLAFIPSGLYITRAFATRRPHEVYWADLAGAAVATITTFAAIPLLSTEGFICVLLLVTSAAGTALAIRARRMSQWKTAAFFIVLLCISGIFLYGARNILTWSPFYLTQKTPNKDPYKIFNRHPEYTLLKKYDNLISKIEVFQSAELKRKKQYAVAFDGYPNDAFDNSLPEKTWKDARFVWGLLENPRIFIVGASAQGVVKTARNITSPGNVHGTEINPAIYRIMAKDFIEEANYPYRDTDIKIGNALHHFRNSEETYDIIVLMNIHSTPRISIPGTPDTIQTVESYETYFKRLSDQGYLMIEERPDTIASDYAVNRQIITIWEALKRSGAVYPADHFFIYSWKYIGKNEYKPHTFNSYTGILVKKTPLTSADRKAILDWYSIRIRLPHSTELPNAEDVINAEKRSRFQLDYLRGFHETRRFQRLFEAIARGKLSAAYPQWDMRIVDRDRPYLPYVNNSGLSFFEKLGGALLAICFCMVVALATLLIQRRDPGATLQGSYQILIGAGYLILEILFLQFYQEDFRSPATAFVVILTTLLLTSSIGGYVISRRLPPYLALAGVIFSLAMHSLLHSGTLDTVSSQSAKISVILMAIATSGFFMGYFLPFGLNAARKSGYTEQNLSNLFGLNCLSGAATPMLVLFLSSRISLSFSLWTAASLYALATILSYVLGTRKRGRPLSTSGMHICVLILFFSIYMAVTSYISSQGSFFSKKVDALFVWDDRPSASASYQDYRGQDLVFDIKPTRTIKDPAIDHPKSVLISPDGKRAYIQNLYGHSVSVLDTNSREVIKSIPLKGRACEAELSPDGRWLWVSLAALEDDKGTYPKYIPEPTPGWETYNFPSVVNLIDTTQDDGTVIAEIPVGVKPKILRLSPDGKHLLVSNFNSGTVSVIDTESRQVIETIRVGQFPRGICFAQEGKFAYIANMGSHEIMVIDMDKLKVVRSLALEATPRHLLTSPDGKFIYFTDASTKGHLYKLDSSTGAVEGRASTGAISRTFVLSPDGTKAFVGNYKSSNVTVVDTRSMTTTGQIRTPPLPIGLALSPDGKELWVSSFKKSSISVYNTDSL